MRLTIRIAALVLGLVAGTALASPLQVTLTAAPDNPSSPRMGDHLKFHSTIHNTGSKPVNGVIAWISLLRIDPGHEQPVDLEDWSAQKALTTKQLVPRSTVSVDWPMRLISAGTYRVVVSTATRDQNGITTSPAVDFKVAPKPVVESRRVLPIALGMPLALGFVVMVRGWRERRSARHA